MIALAIVGALIIFTGAALALVSTIMWACYTPWWATSAGGVGFVAFLAGLILIGVGLVRDSRGHDSGAPLALLGLLVLVWGVLAFGLLALVTYETDCS